MATILTTICAEDSCGVKIDNVSGFQSLDNPGGFLTSNAGAASTPKNYAINEVYFYTFLLLSNYNNTLTNITLEGNYGDSVVYNSNYTWEEHMNASSVTQHALPGIDGYFHIYQLAIPKLILLNDNRATATNKYFVNTEGIVIAVNSLGEQRQVTNLVTEFFSTPYFNWGTTNIVETKTEFVSKCFLEGCLNSILTEFASYYADPACSVDKATLKTLRDKRDLLFAVTNTVEYYAELDQLAKAGKLIADVAFCNICKDYAKTVSGCNCNS